MTDRQRLLVLLETLTDDLPMPETWTGRMQRRALVERRPSPSTRIVCDLCEGRGRLHSLRPCTACGGDPSDGTPGRGFRVIDDYTGDQVASEQTEAKAMMVDVVCDRCGGSGRLSAYSRQTPAQDAMRCDRCAGSGRVRTPDARRISELLRPERADSATDSEEYVLAALERRDEQGSYLELERALAVLRGVTVGGFRLVVAVHVDGRIREHDLVPTRVVELDRALAFVEAILPRPIRVPAAAEKRRVREAPPRVKAAEVVRLVEAGVAVPDVCRQVGLQRSRVYEIVAQAEARRVERENEEAA